jgi:hypothetical protein
MAACDPAHKVECHIDPGGYSGRCYVLAFLEVSLAGDVSVELAQLVFPSSVGGAVHCHESVEQGNVGPEAAINNSNSSKANRSLKAHIY